MLTIGFDYGTQLEDPAIGHQLIVYSDTAAAVNGFEEYGRFVYTNIWVEPNEIDFHPITPEDLIEHKCVKLEINGKLVQNCVIMQQHKNYVSAIDVRMGEPYLTFEILNSILSAIDQKLN